MDTIALETYKKAGHIAVQAVAFARSFIKPNMTLIEIAESIEAKIVELGGKPAFPVNLSINEIAAHATPKLGDTEKARGLLKVDIGVHLKGFVADTAFSIDLENSEENKKLIASAEKALAHATQLVISNRRVKIREIGRIIAKTIEEQGFQPIRNLSGHSIELYNLHAGITIPNYDNAQEKVLDLGVYAIEPFATLATGSGMVRDGKSSNIYALIKEGVVRDQFAREVLKYILEQYETLPFCTRWLQKQFGSRALLALARLEQAGILHHYPQLIEQSGEKVAQAEHTIILTENEAVITTAVNTSKINEPDAQFHN